MPTLSARLAQRPAATPVLATASGWVTCGELLDEARGLQTSLLAPARNKSVSLACRDPRRLLTFLLALDGWASWITLCDPLADPETLARFESAARASFRMTDAGMTPLPPPTIPADAAGDSRWVIPTSGTTGEPKLVGHTLASLTHTVKPPASAATELRWGLLYEPTRFAGLQVVFQALLGGASLIIPPDYRQLEQAAACLLEHGCNAISATPSLWRKLAMTGLLPRFSLRVVTLGGEAADQKILDLLADAFPHAVIRHIYASTEAGVGFSVADRQAGFPSAYLAHLPQGGQLRVRPEDGMLFVKPQQTEQRYVGAEPRDCAEDGWVETGDLVVLRDDRWHFLGRANGTINVGGLKVHPTEVERVIMEVPGVLAARVFAKSNPILGALVAAEVVPDPAADPKAIEPLIRAHAKNSLARHQIPAFITFTREISLNPTGKIQR